MVSLGAEAKREASNQPGCIGENMIITAIFIFVVLFFFTSLEVFSNHTTSRQLLLPTYARKAASAPRLIEADMWYDLDPEADAGYLRQCEDFKEAHFARIKREQDALHRKWDHARLMRELGLEAVIRLAAEAASAPRQAAVAATVAAVMAPSIAGAEWYEDMTPAGREAAERVATARERLAMGVVPSVKGCLGAEALGLRMLPASRQRIAQLRVRVT